MGKRFFLTEGNIAEYLLTQAAKEFSFELKKVTSVEEVTKYTNACFVYRVNCLTSRGKKILYLKQSDGYVKRNRRIRVDPERVIIEGEKLRLLESLLGKEIVPMVLYIDLQNYILVMDDIQGKKKILVEEFDKHKVYPQLAEKFGIFFGTLHGKTYNTPLAFDGADWQKRIHGIWRDWVMFGAKKLVAKEVISKFTNQSDKAKKAFIWGDPVHRNIFVSKYNFSVLDFDFAIHHDPAFDNGIFLAHWVIKLLEGNEQVVRDCRYFIKYFNKAYIETMRSFGISAQEIEGIIRRITVWTGVYMVSRTDGRSGSYYKNQPRLEAKIRETGLALITRSENKTADWYTDILTK